MSGIQVKGQILARIGARDIQIYRSHRERDISMLLHTIKRNTSQQQTHTNVSRNKEKSQTKNEFILNDSTHIKFQKMGTNV